MEQGRMMDAGVNPVVVDYDANSLSLYGEMFSLRAISKLEFYGEKKLDNFFNREL